MIEIFIYYINLVIFNQITTVCVLLDIIKYAKTLASKKFNTLKLNWLL